jgi:hypothetical protein
MAWGKKLSLPARKFITQMNADFNGGSCTPSDWTSCMAFETGETFSPSVKNPHSTGTGLIQFMEYTCEWLSDKWGQKVTTAMLSRMSVEEQLKWVWKYFHTMIASRGKPKDIGDIYMLIYWPAAAGKPSNTPLHSKGTSAYAVNKGLDVDRNGVITKAEAESLVRAKLAKGMTQPFYG